MCKSILVFISLALLVPQTLLSQVDLSSRGPEGELVYETFMRDSTHIRVWNIGETSLYRSGSSEGVHYVGAFGPLKYIIEEHNSQTFLDIRNLERITDNYKVSIQCLDNIKVDSVIADATVDWLNGIGIPASFVENEKKVYALSIIDKSLLMQHLHEEDDGIIARMNFESNNVRIVGRYEALIGNLHGMYIKEPILRDFEFSYDDPIINYDFSRSSGLASIQKLLLQEYGISLKREKRKIQVLSTKKKKK
jgi:hypothetical protein